ncbi:hypothetical protein AYI68_g4847 [Smittium mucronatum]|uniref:Uncharacterized protein n=1 Tax=Smittium mucronatum TaxID=133383 RepID=A0A1R0GVY6_9FUNG|nr:hypothetical protein AYI68_g4847 [Smittium mucronatum]
MGDLIPLMGLKLPESMLKLFLAEKGGIQLNIAGKDKNYNGNFELQGEPLQVRFKPEKNQKFFVYRQETSNSSIESTPILTSKEGVPWDNQGILSGSLSISKSTSDRAESIFKRIELAKRKKNQLAPKKPKKTRLQNNSFRPNSSNNVSRNSGTDEEMDCDLLELAKDLVSDISKEKDSFISTTVDTNPLTKSTKITDKNPNLNQKSRSKSPILSSNHSKNEKLSPAGISQEHVYKPFKSGSLWPLKLDNFSVNIVHFLASGIKTVKELMISTKLNRNLIMALLPKLTVKNGENYELKPEIIRELDPKKYSIPLSLYDSSLSLKKSSNPPKSSPLPTKKTLSPKNELTIPSKPKVSTGKTGLNSNSDIKSYGAVKSEPSCDKNGEKNISIPENTVLSQDLPKLNNPINNLTTSGSPCNPLPKNILLSSPKATNSGLNPASNSTSPKSLSLGEKINIAKSRLTLSPKKETDLNGSKNSKNSDLNRRLNSSVHSKIRSPMSRINANDLKKPSKSISFSAGDNSPHADPDKNVVIPNQNGINLNQSLSPISQRNITQPNSAKVLNIQVSSEALRNDTSNFLSTSEMNDEEASFSVPISLKSVDSENNKIEPFIKSPNCGNNLDSNTRTPKNQDLENLITTKSPSIKPVEPSEIFSSKNISNKPLFNEDSKSPNNSIISKKKEQARENQNTYQINSDNLDKKNSLYPLNKNESSSYNFKDNNIQRNYNNHEVTKKKSIATKWASKKPSPVYNRNNPHSIISKSHQGSDFEEGEELEDDETLHNYASFEKPETSPIKSPKIAYREDVSYSISAQKNNLSFSKKADDIHSDRLHGNNSHNKSNHNTANIPSSNQGNSTCVNENENTNRKSSSSEFAYRNNDYSVDSINNRSNHLNSDYSSIKSNPFSNNDNHDKIYFKSNSPFNSSAMAPVPNDGKSSSTTINDLASPLLSEDHFMSKSNKISSVSPKIGNKLGSGRILDFQSPSSIIGSNNDSKISVPESKDCIIESKVCFQIYKYNHCQFLNSSNSLLKSESFDKYMRGSIDLDAMCNDFYLTHSNLVDYSINVNDFLELSFEGKRSYSTALYQEYSALHSKLYNQYIFRKTKLSQYLSSLKLAISSFEKSVSEPSSISVDEDDGIDTNKFSNNPTPPFDYNTNPFGHSIISSSELLRIRYILTKVSHTEKHASKTIPLKLYFGLNQKDESYNLYIIRGVDNKFYLFGIHKDRDIFDPSCDSYSMKDDRIGSEPQINPLPEILKADFNSQDHLGITTDTVYSELNHPKCLIKFFLEQNSLPDDEIESLKNYSKFRRLLPSEVEIWRLSEQIFIFSQNQINQTVRVDIKRYYEVYTKLKMVHKALNNK